MRPNCHANARIVVDSEGAVLSRLSAGDGAKHADTGLVGDRPVAVAVDAPREQQEIVVRALGVYKGQTEGIAGASILGDGQVVLILDVASPTKAAMLASRNAAEPDRRIS